MKLKNVWLLRNPVRFFWLIGVPQRYPAVELEPEGEDVFRAVFVKSDEERIELLLKKASWSDLLWMVLGNILILLVLAWYPLPIQTAGILGGLFFFVGVFLMWVASTPRFWKIARARGVSRKGALFYTAFALFCTVLGLLIPWRDGGINLLVSYTPFYASTFFAFGIGNVLVDRKNIYTYRRGFGIRFINGDVL